MQGQSLYSISIVEILSYLFKLLKVIKRCNPIKENVLEFKIQKAS